jgi:hypothetical protein
VHVSVKVRAHVGTRASCTRSNDWLIVQTTHPDQIREAGCAHLPSRDTPRAHVAPGAPS